MEPALNAILTLLKRNRDGEALGVFSVCSSNRFVLQAAISQAKANQSTLLVESTSNQVNQFGGYTGLRPEGFVNLLKQMAEAQGFAADRICFGADHAGPNVWQAEPSEIALSKAAVLMADSVKAGYQKIHLDASMKCADDDPLSPLKPDTIAARAALLCRACEAAAEESPSTEMPVYVIGTEVPIPGGAHGAEEGLRITSAESANETIQLTKEAFAKLGLESAWERVIALVIQPGVEFGDSGVHVYKPEKTRDLVEFIQTQPRMVYEVHSTDYQPTQALAQLVADHFGILKVGPALTFALREALFALAAIEDQLLTLNPDWESSHLVENLELCMQANPVFWENYYGGESARQRIARKYSFSDRSRYYWDLPIMQTAIAQLLTNLNRQPMPLTLLSQFLPCQYAKVRDGSIPNQPSDLIIDKISEVLRVYEGACGGIQSLITNH